MIIYFYHILKKVPIYMKIIVIQKIYQYITLIKIFKFTIFEKNYRGI